MSQPEFSFAIAYIVTLIVPLVILITCVFLAVKYITHRKIIGTSLALIGVFEIIAHLQVTATLNGISYQIPYIPRLILLLQGFLTIIGGLATIHYAKPKKTQRDLQKITESKI